MDEDLIRIVRQPDDPQTRVLVFRPDHRGRVSVTISLGRRVLREPPDVITREVTDRWVAVIIQVQAKRFALNALATLNKGLAAPNIPQRLTGDQWWVLAKTQADAVRMYQTARSRVEHVVSATHLEARWDGTPGRTVAYDGERRVWCRGHEMWSSVSMDDLPGEPAPYRPR